MATAEVANAKAALQRAEAEVADAKAEVADAKALAATNVAYAGMYASAQKGYAAAQKGYAAAQNGYAAAQQTLQTAMQRGSGGSVLNVPPAVAAPDSTNNAVVLTNILQKLDALGAEVSRTRSASGINVEDFERVVEMLRIRGPISEDIHGNLVEDEDILKAMLGDELFWDERYEEQQREEYRKVVEGWLANMKKNRRIRWVNGNRACIKHRFEGLNFDVSSKNDMIAVSRSFGELFGQGALLGVEMKRKRMTKKSLRQAMVEFFLWADASVFPFVQLLTDMQRGGVAFYCKTIDARRGIELRQVILKDMQEVKAFVSRIGASFPDDLGDDTPNGLIIPETFDDPPRKKFKPLETPDEGSFSKAGKALWTIGCRLLENEGDVANLADVMDLDSFQQQEVY